MDLRDDIALLRGPPSAQAAVAEARIQIGPFDDDGYRVATIYLLQCPCQIAVEPGPDLYAAVRERVLQIGSLKTLYM